MELDRYFGQFGGMFSPESLVGALTEIEQAFIKIQTDVHFQKNFHELLTEYAGRPTALTYCKNLSTLTQRHIYLKREDLLHGGAHKTNNCIGQGLMAQFLGKKRIIAETGAGQHRVATAMIGALLNIPVEIYMGQVDVERQSANVQRMELFGAKINTVTSGSQTLKDAVTEALCEIGSPIQKILTISLVPLSGPYPFPSIEDHFQKLLVKS